jgi:hypothetical protein
VSRSANRGDGWCRLEAGLVHTESSVARTASTGGIVHVENQVTLSARREITVAGPQRDMNTVPRVPPDPMTRR